MGRFCRQSRVALLSAGCLLACAAALLAQDVFRVEVKLVRVLAGVKDESGGVVGGLKKADFTLFDNGVQQEIALFERHTSQPLSIGLLLDISGSTNKELKYETESVGRFLNAAFREGNPQDTVALYTFNWQVTREVEYTRNAGAIERRLRRLKGEAGTSLYDAIYLASQDIHDRPGRHVLVVVTDGGDTVSSKNYHDAMRAAHAADAVLYSILVMPITSEAGRNVGGENALTGLAQSTGGKVFSPGINGLDMVFEEILRDLRTQYLLGFYPKNVSLNKDPFHKIVINLSQPGLRVVSRTGYYGDVAPTGQSRR